jgi:uncharacterized membrane protein
MRPYLGGFYRGLLMALAIVIIIHWVPGASAQSATVTANDSDRPIYVEGYITGTETARSDTSYPVPGAVIYFIRNQKIVNQSRSNAIGYYNVVITPGTYSVVTAASGFQTLMTEEEFRGTRTLNRILTKVPYNGIVPYVVNPVVETSPGRPVAVTICVENSQVTDQYVAFTLQAPETDYKNWYGWCPDGEMVGIRSGDKREVAFMFQYNGDRRGAYVCYILVTGGAFYARVPVVVVVKDLPYETLDLYTNYPERTVKAGDTAHFVFSVNNRYKRDKPLQLDIEKPEGWGATTGNGTAFYAAEGQIASSDFWVYVPRGTAPGHYTVNLTLKGQDASSNKLTLRINVEGTPLYEAIIKGYRSVDGCPSINLSDGDAFDLPVRVYNDGDFPIEIMATAEVGDNWAYYLSGAPWGRITVEPGSASEFDVRARVPNGTAGNYTAKIYLEGGGQDTTLIAQLRVLPRSEPALKASSIEGLLLAAGTAGVVALALAMSRKRGRR